MMHGTMNIKLLFNLFRFNGDIMYHEVYHTDILYSAHSTRYFHLRWYFPQKSSEFAAPHSTMEYLNEEGLEYEVVSPDIHKLCVMYITFTVTKDNFPAISIKQTVLPQVESVKYLGLHFDWKLKLERAHCKEKKTNWLKSKRNYLANRKKLKPIIRKQIAVLQDGDQTHLDIRNRTVGMRQQNQCSNHTEIKITIKNPQNHSKCPLVCIKPHTAYRPQHPLCKWGH
jgi:hypothetical protein